MQLTAKEAKGKALTLDELDLQKQVTKIVECGPCDNQQSGIFSWRIKSLKNLLENKCVFWTNSEEKLPCGSVADKSTTEAPKGGIASDGGGNEIIEFWSLFTVSIARCLPTLHAFTRSLVCDIAFLVAVQSCLFTFLIFHLFSVHALVCLC
jgi:hypothetical protein